MDETYFAQYLIKEAPKTVYYIKNFIDESEESFLLKNIYEAPKPKWTCLSNRRLQDYGGVPHAKGMLAENIPRWLLKYMDKVSSLNVFTDSTGDIKKANHCLINEYLAGQGIMPHFDGPVFTPTITTISCGSHTVLEFFEENEGERKPVCKLLLEPRSLIIVKDEMYTKYLHSISEVKNDLITEDCINLNYTNGATIGETLERKTRISLTIRNVPNVVQCNLLKLFKK